MILMLFWPLFDRCIPRNRPSSIRRCIRSTGRRTPREGWMIRTPKPIRTMVKGVPSFASSSFSR